jgi:hypothetical protein
MTRDSKGWHVSDVTTDILGSGEKAAIVLFRFKQNDVQFGKEQQNQRDDGGQ